MSSKVEKIMLRPGEAAEAIGLGRSTIYAMIASGELPAVRVGAGGRSVRIPVEALREWINARLQNSTADHDR